MEKARWKAHVPMKISETEKSQMKKVRRKPNQTRKIQTKKVSWMEVGSD